MIGIARRIEMDVGIGTCNAGGLHRRILLLLRQFLTTVINVLIDQIALLHPAFCPARGAHSRKAPVAIQYLHPFSISYHTRFVIDRRNLIAQDCLRGGHVSDLLHPTASPTTGQQHNREHQQETETPINFHLIKTNIARQRFGSYAKQDLTLLAVAKADAHSAGSAHHLTIRIHGFHLTHSIRDLDRLNALIAQAHHLSETTVGNEFHGRNSKARSQDAIERRWRPATLNVPQHADPHFLSSAGSNRVTHQIADRSSAAVFFQLRRKFDPLSHHHNREMFAKSFPFGHILADSFDGERNLGNQNDVRSASNAGFQPNPARIASHDLDHHDAMVRLRRGMNLVYRLCCGMQRGIESKRNFGGTKIVVNGLGHTHDLQALAEKFERNLLRAVAADADDGINSKLACVDDDLIRYVADDLASVLNRPVIERVAPISGPKDSAATRQDAADVLQRELVRFLWPDQAIKSIRNADDLPF